MNRSRSEPEAEESEKMERPISSAARRTAEANRFSRREMIRFCGMAAVAPSLISLPGFVQSAHPYREPNGAPYKGTDDQLLDEMQRASFEFFWNEASETTGQVKDRSLANGNDSRRISSIAATGFGLTSLCIASQRKFRNPIEIQERARKVLRYLWKELPHEHGFYYHFIDMETGERLWDCEVSSIDTSILLCGVLTARQYFSDTEIQDLAAQIYHRVDWPWMLNGGTTLSMGWKPESGFLDARWERYCELMMIYLLAIGSPTHPVAPDSWSAWARPVIRYKGIEFISGNDPLFTHQYSQAWFDFRKKRDAYANYFENSEKATKAHKLFCLSLSDRFPDYSENLWGITASDSQRGYTAWGGPPAQGEIDGSIVPCAAAGSLPFLPADCISVLRHIRGAYREGAWKRYSFVDAFNPLTSWFNSDVLGIDLGISMLMAENHRSGFVWNTFMKNSEAQEAMKKAGFHAE
jgi:hypothetical protein